MMLKTTYILFVIYITAIYAYERKGYPDYKYQDSVGGWMKLHEKPANWQAAVDTCIKEGAVLVASQFNEVDGTLIKIAKESNKTIDYLFIGSQSLSAPTKQEAEEFNQIDQVNCVVLVTSKAIKKSVDCNEEYPFICYAPRTEVVDCDFSGAGEDRVGFPGYHRCNETGGWVKIHPGPKDYDDAKKTCNEEGGELIDPDDPKFKEIALKLIKAKGSDGKPLVIYGKTRITHPTGGFVERNGQMVFEKNLPPYCTLLYPNGTIDHRVGCDQKVGFICHVPFPDEPTVTTTVKPDEVKDDTCGEGQEKVDNPGYKKCKDVEGWVKVHPGPKDQDEAKKTCDKEGGELIDPSDPKFKEIALKLTKNNPITIFGKTRKPRPDDGFVKEGGKTRFVKKKQEFCTVVYPNGTIDDEVNCDQKAGFICYIPFDDDKICTDEGRQGYEGYKGCKGVDGWVKVHPGPNDFDEAKETCDKEGGVMIDLNDPKFKKIALKLIRPNITSVYGKNMKTSKDSGFTKVGGKTKFLKKNKEFCSILHPDGTIDDEVDCDKKSGFVCYVKYPVEFSCGDGDYTYDQSTGNCYKVYSIGKTWAESRKQCQVDGGDLVIIRSEKEANALQEIYANHDMEFVVNHPTHMWAGFLENSPNTWETVEAKSLDTTGYNVWARGKPSKKPVNEKRQSCGAVNMLGKYVDCWCEVKHGYICQKKVTVSKITQSTIQHGLRTHLDIDLDLGLGIFRAQAQPQMSVTRIHL